MATEGSSRFETNIRGLSEDTAIAYSPDGGMAATTVDEMDKALWEEAVRENFGIGDTTPTLMWQNGRQVLVTKPGVNSEAIIRIEDKAAQSIVDKRRGKSR